MNINNILSKLKLFEDLLPKPKVERSIVEVSREWNEFLNDLNAKLEGTISSLRDAVLANGGRVPDLKSFRELGIEFFPSVQLENLENLKKKIKDRLFRTREASSGSKYYFIGHAIRSIEKALLICANLIRNKEIFFQQDNLKEKLNEIVRKEIEPLINYSSQLVQQSHNAERIF